MPWNHQIVLFILVLARKDTTVCTGFLLYGGQTACFTDSTNIDTSVWVGFVEPKIQRGCSQSVHTDVFKEAGVTYYVNPLMEKASVSCNG